MKKLLKSVGVAVRWRCGWHPKGLRGSSIHGAVEGHRRGNVPKPERADEVVVFQWPWGWGRGSARPWARGHGMRAILADVWQTLATKPTDPVIDLAA